MGALLAEKYFELSSFPSCIERDSETFARGPLVLGGLLAQEPRAAGSIILRGSSAMDSPESICCTSETESTFMPDIADNGRGVGRPLSTQRETKTARKALSINGDLS